MTSPRFFMCRPDYFGINYEINPWMNKRVEVNPSKAMKQWESLVSILKDDLHADIDLISPVEGQPDMVFTANAGCINDKTFIPSRFRFEQRRGEESHFRHWFENNGYKVVDLKIDSFFEGCGDALSLDDTVFAGYRFRSDITSHAALAKVLNQKVISLELTQEWFYHLDTCFCPLDRGDVIYYPAAFDVYGCKAIEASIDAEKILRVNDEEAQTFCCNAVSVEDNVVMNVGAPKLVKELERRGYNVYQADLSEFLKSGGSAKCLTLRLEEEAIK